MKREFEVGERIVCYFSVRRHLATVVGVYPKHIQVDTNHRHGFIDVHRGQCRHLKRKPVPKKEQKELFCWLFPEISWIEHIGLIRPIGTPPKGCQWTDLVGKRTRVTIQELPEVEVKENSN